MRSLALPLLLAACASPAPHLAGVTPVTVVEGPSRFLLYRDGGRAEVIRTSVEQSPDLPRVMHAAIRAAARTTGCTVAWAQGDAARIEMGLACSSAAAPPPRSGPVLLDCEVRDAYARPDSALSELSLDCIGA